MNLEEAAKTVLEPLGYEVLELSVSGQGNKRRVLLRIDRLDEKRVSTDDVALASEVFGLELDRLDPFPEPYALEVESPGAERPLFRRRHFERFCDLAAKVTVGGHTFKGIIRAVSDDSVTFEVGQEYHTYAIGEIRARLAEWPSTPR